MRLIGRVLLTKEQVDRIGDVIVLARDQWKAHVRAKPREGDILWAQERHVVFQDKKREHWREVVPGDPTTAKRPDYLKNRELKLKFNDGSKMARTESRFTLEVIELSDLGNLRCAVHHENIHAFMQREAA